MGATSQDFGKGGQTNVEAAAGKMTTWGRAWGHGRIYNFSLGGLPFFGPLGVIITVHGTAW